MAEFDLLGFLTGVSPWWWIAFAVALVALEMVTFTYFVLWLSIAAFATGLILAVVPGLSGGWQIGLFAMLALAITIAGRYWIAARAETPSDAPTLNKRSEQLVGRAGRALDDFDGGEGVIVIDDIRWRARMRSGAASKNQRLAVVAAEGMTLICETG